MQVIVFGRISTFLTLFPWYLFQNDIYLCMLM